MATKKESAKASENQELVIPDYLKGVQGQDAGAMASGVGISVPRISLKGRQFRFIIGGEEEMKTGDPIEVVLLGVEPEQGMAKTWYEKGYQPGSTDPPDCSSWDGIHPDSWVNKQQSPLCANCQHMVWGSAKSMSGKKAKACKESKRIIVTRLDDLEGPAFIMNVTIASLKALSTYGQFLAKNNLPFSAIKTRISFVDSDFPEVEFEFAGFLEEDNGKAMLSRAEEKEWKQFSSSTPALPNNAPAQGQIAAPIPTESNAPPVTNEDVNNLVNNW
jgi:hypothetical protein